MKRLVCEMCGGTDIIKKDGLFECQSCGIKYSLEEAKKMMVEGVVEVQGKVQVDNTNMVETWMKLGLNAANSGNSKEAYDYFTKVVEVEPKNWRAIFEKGKAAAWQSTLASPRTAELYQAIKRSIEIINEQGLSETEKTETINEFAVAVFNVNNALLDLRKQNFDRYDDKFYDLHFNEWFELHYTQSISNINSTEAAIEMISNFDDDLSKDNVLFMKKHICEILCFICSTQDTYWDSYNKYYLSCFGLYVDTKKPFIDKYLKLVKEIRKEDPNFRKNKYQRIDPFNPPERWQSDRYEMLEKHWSEIEKHEEMEIEKQKKKERIEKYWNNHKDEEKRLKDELKSISVQTKEKQLLQSNLQDETEKLYKLKNKELDSERQIAELNHQITELANKKKKVGLLNGKEKRKIQGEIDNLKEKIIILDNTANKERDEYNKKIDKEIDEKLDEQEEIENEIRVLSKRKQNIQNEFKKDRK